MIVHLAEALADRRARMIGAQRGIPFQRAQKLLADAVIVGMAQGAQAGCVQGFGSAVKSAQQRIVLSPPPRVVPSPLSPAGWP